MMVTVGSALVVALAWAAIGYIIGRAHERYGK